jgi:hypothetical protein
VAQIADQIADRTVAQIADRTAGETAIVAVTVAGVEEIAEAMEETAAHAGLE